MLSVFKASHVVQSRLCTEIGIVKTSKEEMPELMKYSQIKSIGEKLIYIFSYDNTKANKEDKIVL